MEILTSILIIFIGGFFMRLSLISAGQAWAKTYGQTVSFFLLPIITHIITKVIYGNIALSLGMIGALSIVRFRHPVRSPLELGIYFYLIGLGISASVNIKWTILLGFSVLSIFVIFYIVEILFKRFNHNLFLSSFTEGNVLATLEITADHQIDEVIKSDFLINIEKDDNIYFYRLASNNKKELLSIFKMYENKSNIKKISFSS